MKIPFISNFLNRNKKNNREEEIKKYLKGLLDKGEYDKLKDILSVVDERVDSKLKELNKILDLIKHSKELSKTSKLLLIIVSIFSGLPLFISLLIVVFGGFSFMSIALLVGTLLSFMFWFITFLLLFLLHKWSLPILMSTLNPRLELAFEYNPNTNYLDLKAIPTTPDKEYLLYKIPEYIKTPDFQFDKTFVKILNYTLGPRNKKVYFIIPQYPITLGLSNPLVFAKQDKDKVLVTDLNPAVFVTLHDINSILGLLDIHRIGIEKISYESGKGIKQVLPLPKNMSGSMFIIILIGILALLGLVIFYPIIMKGMSNTHTQQIIKNVANLSTITK